MLSAAPVSSIRASGSGAQKIAIALAILFVVLVTLLHFVRPDLPPRTHVLSEYALGAKGWLMEIAFFTLGGAFTALLLALKSQLSSWRGRLGAFGLTLATLGAFMGGLFPMDPIGTPMDQQSTTAQLHNLAFMLGGPGVLLAITFINWRLAKLDSWKSARPMLIGTALFAWLMDIGFSYSMYLLMGNPQGSDAGIGIWNRLFVLSWVVWVMLLARSAKSR